MELQDFSDDDDEHFGSPIPETQAPDCAGEDEDGDPGPLLTSVVHDDEEDEDDINEHEYEPQYSHMLVRRTATRMKSASAAAGARHGRKHTMKTKKEKKSTTLDLPTASLTDDNGLTEIKEETEAVVVLSDKPAAAKVLKTETEPDNEEEDDDGYGGDDKNDDTDENEEADDDDDYHDDDDGENVDDHEREFVESNMDEEHNMVVEPEQVRLREIFDRCLMIMIGRKDLGADRLLLVNVLRFDLDEGELADEVLVLQSQFISWSTLVELYIVHSRHGRHVQGETTGLGFTMDREVTSLVADEEGELAQQLQSPPPTLPPPPPGSFDLPPLFIVKPSTPRASTPPREPSPYSSPTHASQHHLQLHHGRRKEEQVAENAVPLPIPLIEHKPTMSTELLLNSVKRALEETAAHSTTALALAEEKISKQNAGLPIKPPKPSQAAKDAARTKVAEKTRLDATREIVTVELSENFRPPPLSDFAHRSGIIFEGWLEKRSRSGIWQRRFCVLAESQTEFCVLRIFGKSNKTSWGEVGSLLKAAIAVITIEKIETKTASDATASGREFALHVSDCTHFVQDEHAVTTTASSMSETAEGLDAREICFRADSGAGRLMWVTFIRRAREFALDAYE